MHILNDIRLSNRKSDIQIIGMRIQLIHNIMQENITQVKRSVKFKPFESVVNLSRRCQVCLSKTDFQENRDDPLDKLITCQLCLSSIHQKHYGGNLIYQVPYEWYCERCQFLLNNQEGKTEIDCQFCPEKSGIMKIIQIDKKKVWSHLQCITWDYPIRAFTCEKLISVKRLSQPSTQFQKFWCPQFPNPKCQRCFLSSGQFIKCRYYSCSNHYHVPCARALGIIRELEQMRVQSGDDFIYIPVLCPEHLQRRGIDFRIKADKAGDKQKHKYITNLAKAYEKQYSQLLKSSKQETKTHNYRLVYESQLPDSAQEMEIESLSQETIIGEQSVYSANFCEYLEKQLENVFDGIDIDKL